MKCRLVFALVASSFLTTVAQAAEPNWTILFDGKTLDGWTVKGGKAAYKAKNGMIVGTTVEGRANTFLCRGPYSDFELELDTLCDKAFAKRAKCSATNAKLPPRPRACPATSGTRGGTPSGSMISRRSRKRLRPSRMRRGTTIGSWSRVTTSGPGSRARSPPAAPRWSPRPTRCRRRRPRSRRSRRLLIGRVCKDLSR